MTTENDFQQDIESVQSYLREADDLFKESKFLEAEPLYEQALDILERTYAEQHPDRAHCLQNLGDVCYSLNKYTEANKIYQRLLILREKSLGNDHPAVISTTFKIAKTYEKRSMFDESETWYKRAAMLAKEAFMPGHPLLNSVLEGYATMLKRKQSNLEEQEKLEELSKVTRDKVAKKTLRLNALKEETLEEGEAPVSQGKEDSEAKAEAKAEPAQAGASLKTEAPSEVPAIDPTKPKLTTTYTRLHALSQAERLDTRRTLFGRREQIISGSLLLLVLFWSIYLMNTMSIHKKTVSQKQSLAVDAPGRVYRTDDGKEILSFGKGGEVILDIDNKEMVGRYVNPFAALFLSQTAEDTWFEATEQGLKDQDGMLLRSQDQGQAEIVEKMRQVAAAAQQYYTNFHRYPDDINELIKSNIGLKSANPFTGKEEAPIIISYSKREIGSNTINYASSDLDKVCAGEGIFDREPVLTPGAIHCYKLVTEHGHDLFYVRGCDEHGAMIRMKNAPDIFFYKLRDGQVKTPEKGLDVLNVKDVPVSSRDLIVRVTHRPLTDVPYIKFRDCLKQALTIGAALCLVMWLYARNFTKDVIDRIGASKWEKAFIVLCLLQLMLFGLEAVFASSPFVGLVVWIIIGALAFVWVSRSK